MQGNNRSAAIDILRFLATMAIFNHLSGSLYGKWSFLGTGGALGITLFFFISGFTLYLGRLDRFDNWYKRRLGRVWPTAFVVAAAYEIFHVGGGALFAFSGSGWFVRDILIAYVVLYMVRAFRIPPIMAFLTAISAACIWHFCRFDYSSSYLFGGNLMRSISLYSFLFLGALTATYQNKIKIRPIIAAGVSLLVFVAFNMLVFLFAKKKLDSSYQFVLLGVQLLFVFMLYCAVKGVSLPRWMDNSVRFVGGLCLEMYLTYMIVRTTRFDAVFPLNIAINFVFALVFAYFIRCLARIFQQTFQKELYDWRSVFSLI